MSIRLVFRFLASVAFALATACHGACAAAETTAPAASAPPERYAVRWDPRAGGPGDVDAVLAALHATRTATLAHAIRFADLGTAASHLPGFASFGQLRSGSDGNQLLVTYVSAETPAALSRPWTCPAATPDRHEWIDVTVCPDCIKREVMRECGQTGVAARSFPAAIAPRERACKIDVAGYEATLQLEHDPIRLVIEAWTRDSDKARLVEVSWRSNRGQQADGAPPTGGTPTSGPTDLQIFGRAVVEPLARAGILPVTQDTTRFGSDCDYAGDASDVALVDDPSRAQLFALLMQYLQVRGSALTAPHPFTFPHDVVWTDPNSNAGPRVGQLFGIDLSHYDTDDCHCTIDWLALQQQQVQFVWLKASQGTRGVDARFDTYRTGARAVATTNRIPVGAYHFLSADGSGADQATHFLKVLSGKQAADDLPPAMDLEWDVRVGADGKVVLGPDGLPYDYWSQLSGDEILRRSLEWLTAVANHTGRRPIVYTNAVWWSQRIGDPSKIALLRNYPIRISDYAASGDALEAPAVPALAAWTLWQFTSTAVLANGGIGVRHSLDADVFAGSLVDFRRAMGLPP